MLLQRVRLFSPSAVTHGCGRSIFSVLVLVLLAQEEQQTGVISSHDAGGGLGANGSHAGAWLLPEVPNNSGSVVQQGQMSCLAMAQSSRARCVSTRADAAVAARCCGHHSLPHEHTDLSFPGHLCSGLSMCTLLWRSSSSQHIKSPWRSSSLSIPDQFNLQNTQGRGDCHMAAIHICVFSFKRVKASIHGSLHPNIIN